MFTQLVISGTPILNNGSAVGISPVNWFTRSTEGESYVSSAFSTSYNNGVCYSAVVQANYRVYTTSSQAGITRIELDVYVQNVAATDYITQKVSVKFFTSDSAKVLSGRPGYITGKPLLSAYSTSATSAALFSNFTVYGSDSTGQCSNSYFPFAPVINYGQDTIVTCSLAMSATALSSFCTGNQISSLLLFTNQKITHVAKYGNITAWNPDDFVAINATSAPASSYSNGVCTVPSILVYDIIFTQVGPYGNPQDKIIQVNKYYKTTTWQSRSSKLETETYLASVVFNYINYDSAFDPYQQAYSANTNLVPNDVVYPVLNAAYCIFFSALIILA